MTENSENPAPQSLVFAADPALAPRALPPRQGEWASVLEPDERLLWQGRPEGGLTFGARQMVIAGIGLVVVVLGGALAMEGAAGLRADAAQAGAVLGLAARALLFGAGCVIVPAAADALRRRGTAYALTDRRALIETDFMGRGLAAWPIGPHSPVWRGRGRRVASVWFAVHRPPARPLLLRPSGRMTAERPVGFENVAQPDKVLALLEQVRGMRA